MVICNGDKVFQTCFIDSTLIIKVIRTNNHLELIFRVRGNKKIGPVVGVQEDNSLFIV